MTYVLAPLLILAASVLVGHAVAGFAKTRGWSWTAPALGLSTLMIVTAPAVWLPGRTVLPLVTIAALAAIGALRFVREPGSRVAPIEFLQLVPAAVLAAFPFIANERAGILGVNFNNDTAAHLWLADTMHSAATAAATPPLDYYPLGPHGIVGSLMAVGVPGEAALTGLTIALPLLTGLTALAFLRHAHVLVRIGTVTLSAFPYLAAAYFAQGAFKELAMALLVLAVAATLTQAAARSDPARFLPVGVVLAGIVSTYSYVGLVWPFAAFALAGAWWGVSTWRATGLSGVRSGVSARFAPITTAGLLTVGLLLPQFPRIQRFWDWSRMTGIAQDDIGNLAGPLDKREALGIWFSHDFRYPPVDLTISTIGALLAAGLAAGALWIWLRRGSYATPAVTLAAVAAVFISEPSQSPYTVAKGLVIVSPLVVVLIGGAVGHTVRSSGLPWRVLAVGCATLAAALGGWSSALALRAAAVGPTDKADALKPVREAVSGKRVLYLGLSDFLGWELRGAQAQQPFLGAPIFETRPQKRWVYGNSFDVDAIPHETLDGFDFVLSPRLASDSAMPENFERIMSAGPYELYRRAGATTPRRTVPTELSNTGAAPLDCGTATGAKTSRTPGTASVRRPVVSGFPAPFHPRSHGEITLELGPGVWDLDLRYVSSRPLTLTAASMRSELPASLHRIGSLWPAGTLTVDRAGPVKITITPEHNEFSVDPATTVAVTEIIAQERGGSRKVSLHDACGQYVDWYTVRKRQEGP